MSSPRETDAANAGEFAHREAILTCICAMRVLLSVDIDEAIATCHHADAVGPIVDPTLWMQKGKAMQEDLELLQAARPLYLKAKQLEATLAGRELEGGA